MSLITHILNKKLKCRASNHFEGNYTLLLNKVRTVQKTKLWWDNSRYQNLFELSE